jgi:hypothetical protein
VLTAEAMPNDMRHSRSEVHILYSAVVPVQASFHVSGVRCERLLVPKQPQHGSVRHPPRLSCRCLSYKESRLVRIERRHVTPILGATEASDWALRDPPCDDTQGR